MRRSSARQRLARSPLTEHAIENILRGTLPRKNDFSAISYGELLDECLRFGIDTRAKFRRLMLRHRRSLISIDQEPLDDVHVRIYRAEFGDAEFADLMRRSRWFTWAALTRFALELEFGDAYREFADKRDGIRDPASASAADAPSVAGPG